MCHNNSCVVTMVGRHVRGRLRQRAAPPAAYSGTVVGAGCSPCPAAPGQEVGPALRRLGGRTVRAAPATSATSSVTTGDDRRLVVLLVVVVVLVLVLPVLLLLLLELLVLLLVLVLELELVLLPLLLLGLVPRPLRGG